LSGGTGPVADMGALTRIVMVRHGVTEFTVAGEAGRARRNRPLVELEGRRQAKAVAVGVRAFIGSNPARVITSSLRRAVETGAAISDELSVRAQIDADWDEQGFGDWDDKSMGFLAAHHPQRERIVGSHDQAQVGEHRWAL